MQNHPKLPLELLECNDSIKKEENGADRILTEAKLKVQKGDYRTLTKEELSALYTYIMQGKDLPKELRGIDLSPLIPQLEEIEKKPTKMKISAEIPSATSSDAGRYNVSGSAASVPDTAPFSLT